ncbi:DUF3102 domain-containing protein [uncultured Clostridium sp.]|uniref:DUF3102 domain-containing protein n=1 Tax=uncultured Clostridium sp. TaxID=59620 RepID=UPI002608D494|nr:DUF3102 domain-containing protein [uncultured Clostridium sp.]
MSNVLVRNEQQIADEILYYVDDTRKRIITNAIEIGRRLIEAKEVVGHGDWGRWLEEKVNFKKSTANNYIRLFNEYAADQLNILGENIKFQAFGNISYTQALELISLDENERLEFVENHDMESISTRELKKEIAELKKKNKENIKAIREENEAEKKQLQEERDKAWLEIASIAEDKRNLEEKINEEAEDKEELELKIVELEKEIEETKNRPVGIVEDKEKFEEEARKRIVELKREKEEALGRLEAMKTESNEYIIQYKIHFETVAAGCKKMLEMLEGMKVNDVDYIKYRQAGQNLLNTMLKRLES